jgi:hypothetical protein
MSSKGNQEEPRASLPMEVYSKVKYHLYQFKRQLNVFCGIQVAYDPSEAKQADDFEHT